MHSIEWNFIHNSLKLYNLRPIIRRWVSIFHNNVESGVINCCYATNSFSVSRGVRQGCPLSPLLLVLASWEVLALKIRQDKLCRGIKLGGRLNFLNSRMTPRSLSETWILSEMPWKPCPSSVPSRASSSIRKKPKQCGSCASLKNNSNKPLEFDCPKDQQSSWERISPMINPKTKRIISLLTKQSKIVDHDKSYSFETDFG